MKDSPAQIVNGLVDGIAVLQELAMSSEPCSGKVIADKLELSPVRVNRLLKTLASLGITYRTKSRKYSVGAGMHVLAAQSMAASGLLNRAIPFLKELSETGKTVALGTLWKKQVCYLFHKGGKQDFYKGLGRINLYDATKSSVGLALLSEQSKEQLLDTLGKKPDKNLLKTLEDAQQNGFASIFHHDHYSIAVPIGQPAYAAIAVSGIKTQVEVRMFASELKSAAKQIASS